MCVIASARTRDIRRMGSDPRRCYNRGDMTFFPSRIAIMFLVSLLVALVALVAEVYSSWTWKSNLLPWGVPGAVLGFIAVLVGGVLSHLRVVKEAEVSLVERFGQFQRVMKPGIHIVGPFENIKQVRVSKWEASGAFGNLVKEVWAAVPTCEIELDLPQCNVVTEDSIQCSVDISLIVRIVDAFKFAYTAIDVGSATMGAAQAQLRAFCAGLRFDGLYHSLTISQQPLVSGLQKALEKFGIEVDRVQTDQVEVPKEYATVTMNRQRQKMQQEMLDDESNAVLSRERAKFEVAHEEQQKRHEEARKHLKETLDCIGECGLDSLQVAAIFHSQVLAESVAQGKVNTIYVPASASTTHAV